MTTVKLTKKDKAKKKGLERGGGTRRERLESKEAAIVSTAYDMFVSRGFAKSKMSEIATLAGVAEGTLYLYFNNKEALARATIASFYEQLTESAEEGVVKFESTREKLVFLASHHLENITKENRILQLLSILDRQTKATSSDSIYTLNKRYVAVFDAVFREGVLKNDVDSSFTGWIIRDVFFGALEYAMRTIEITGRSSEQEKFVNELVDLILGSQAGTMTTEIPMTSFVSRLESVASRLEKIAEESE